MTKQITRQQLSAALVERHGQERQQHLYTASVGIAGLGGLGSNIAVQLTRLGIGHLTLADCDRVEISNLNRQSYRLCDIGRPKPEALTEQLLQINPYLCYEPHFLKLTPQNIPEIFAGCNIICEAFDDPEQKAMLTETVLHVHKFLTVFIETYFWAHGAMGLLHIFLTVRSQRKNPVTE